MPLEKQSRRNFLQALGWMTSTFILAACGDDSGSATPATAPNAPAAGSGGTVTLELMSKGEDTLYDKDRLEAPAGSKITLKFTNKSTGSKLFNWVLTRPNKFLSVINDGLTEGEANGFVKPNDENVIAYTKLLKAGESDTIMFDAPAPGEYPFVCTNPGYFARMKGTLVIK